MKKVLVLSSMIVITVIIAIGSKAQPAGALLSPILDNYYAIKNGLVASDAAGASKFAAAFNAAVSAVDYKSMSSEESDYFNSVKTGLLAESKTIASTKELNKQREAFSKLSQNMITLAKKMKLDTKPVYVEYCPMKKASWLSSEQTIKNPYYGSAMLTCGKVTDTIQ